MSIKMSITFNNIFKNLRDYNPDEKLQETIELLLQNRTKIHEIKRENGKNDDSINDEIEAEFNSILDQIDIKEIRDKKSLFSSLRMMAEKTVLRKVGSVDNFSDLTDQDWMKDLYRSEQYLGDLIDFFLENWKTSPILSVAFCVYQIDYLTNDLKTHPWGKEGVDKIYKKAPEYKELSSYVKNAVERLFWSLFWNESFCRDKEKIKFAVSKNLSEIAAIPPELLRDLGFKQVIDNICIESIKKNVNNIYDIPQYLFKRKPFVMMLLGANPDAFFGLPPELRSDKEIAKFILSKNWKMFVSFADPNLFNEEFLSECGCSSAEIEIIMSSAKKFEEINNTDSLSTEGEPTFTT